MPFTFKATRDLWDYLGQFDALSEMNELAVRDFLHRRDRVRRVAGKSKAAEFIGRKSKQHGICVNASVMQQLATSMAQVYVYTVWNCADGFLYDLRREHQALIESQWAGDADGKSRLKHALENIYGSEKKGIAEIGPHRHSLWEYCQSVRNRRAHPRSTTDESVAEKYDLLRPHVTKLQNEYPTLNAPQVMAAMTFDDSVLLSRVVKDIAISINDRARPEDEQLLKAINGQAKVLTWKNNPRRQRNARITLLRSRFGLNENEAGAILDAGSLA